MYCVKRIRPQKEPSIIKPMAAHTFYKRIPNSPGKRAGLATHKPPALTVSVAGCWNSTMRRVLLPTKTRYLSTMAMPHRAGIIASEILTRRPDSDVGNTSMQDVMHERCHRLTTAAGQQRAKKQTQRTALSVLLHVINTGRQALTSQRYCSTTATQIRL